MSLKLIRMILDKKPAKLDELRLITLNIEYIRNKNIGPRTRQFFQVLKQNINFNINHSGQSVAKIDIWLLT